MDTATARVEPEILDALQTLQPVPIDEFRLLPDCGTCDFLAAQPATRRWTAWIRLHARIDHRDLVIVSSD